MANCINVFEVPVADLARAVSFYSKVLDTDLVVNDDERIAVIPYAKGEVVGVLVECENRKPSEDGVLVGLNVTGRLDNAIARVNEHGGRITREKFQVGPYGNMAWVLDTEGNRIALHSY